MGQLVEVLAVAVEEVGPESPLLGASIDGPTSGRKVAAAAVEIGGWVLAGAELSNPVEVEVAHGGRVVARAPAHRSRPDIAGAFPGEAGAAKAGFEVIVDASRMPAKSTLEVRGRCGSVAVPIGSLRLRRCWREESRAGEAPLVSVVVADPDRSERLGATMRGLGEQRYFPTEVLVVHPAAAAEPALQAWQEQGARAVAAPAAGAEALRNEGIRRSNGQLIAFLEAGTELTPGGLARGVEGLLARPEAAGLVDGLEGEGVAGAIYRRSAFEELGGFERGRGCDEELARRAAAEYDVIFEPGALTAAGES